MHTEVVSLPLLLETTQPSWPTVSYWQGQTQRPAQVRPTPWHKDAKPVFYPRWATDPPHWPVPPGASVMRSAGQEEEHLMQLPSSYGILLIFCF